MKLTPVLVILGLSAAACGDDEAVFIDAALDDPDAEECTRLWDVAADTGAAAVISGGNLELTAEDMADDSVIEVTQTGLTGDFDAQFTFSGFTSGGTGAFLQAAISADLPTPPRKLTAAIGTFPTVGISAADQPAGLVDIQATALVAGTLRFERTGDAVTITATTTDQTATVTATYDITPLQIGVQLGSNMGAIAPETSVSIGAFTITGSGVTADSFDCDSLNP